MHSPEMKSFRIIEFFFIGDQKKTKNAMLTIILCIILVCLLPTRECFNYKRLWSAIKTGCACFSRAWRIHLRSKTTL